MSRASFFEHLQNELQTLRDTGLYKSERTITSPQAANIAVGTRDVLNLCANNYLGLANHPAILQAAKEAIDKYGYGMASVRFICGTQDVHKALEDKISAFTQMDDTILYSSCFDANAGLFETLLTDEDAIISDALNHASIIDGIRLCKATRYRYANNDLAALEDALRQAQAQRFRLIATDGVFSMDGSIAHLQAICDLAEAYDALVMVDESHAAGFLGETGRGSVEYCGVLGRVDIITGTLGKAFGGASGGYTAARQPIVDWLRQRSRPYLFSNTLAPVIASTSLRVFELIDEDPSLRQRLHENSRYFRQALSELGFTLLPGEHPIIPVMLGDAQLAVAFAEGLLEEGIYVIGFSYPVVPHGQARIRTQMSAAHRHEDLQRAVNAFAKVGKRLAVIS